MPIGQVYKRDKNNNAMMRIRNNTYPVVLLGSKSDPEITIGSIVLAQHYMLRKGDRGYFCEDYETDIEPPFRLATPQEIAAYNALRPRVSLVLYDTAHYFGLAFGQWRDFNHDFGLDLELYTEGEISGVLSVEFFRRDRPIDTLKARSGKFIAGDFSYSEDMSRSIITVRSHPGNKPIEQLE